MSENQAPYACQINAHPCSSDCGNPRCHPAPPAAAVPEAAHVLLDNRLKARHGYAQTDPLPWLNFTPKSVRTEAIAVIADLQAQLQQAHQQPVAQPPAHPVAGNWPPAVDADLSAPVLVWPEAADAEPQVRRFDHGGEGWEDARGTLERVGRYAWWQPLTHPARG